MKEEVPYTIEKTFKEHDCMSEEEEEAQDEYRIGGYHPVQLENVFNQRYKIKKKIGMGTFLYCLAC